MAKILVMLITGKENINSEMVSFNFAINAVKNARSTVEFMFLGRGVQAANKKQKSSPQFMDQIEGLKKLSIPVKICEVSMAGEGLTKDDIFPGIEMVYGGVEADARIQDGYSVITF
ncbi:DsrE family protein [Oxyplasma meridianum]|uniref:DsrE family protein n=1 Tax=Oxyplasma meridianum TaxID=3073602 RepID=A0AAX4NGK9_9ARCH